MPRARAWLCGLLTLIAPLVARAQAAEPTFLAEERGQVIGARLFATTVSDPYRKRTLLFGGATNGGVRNDTVEWDGIGWTRRSPSVAPPPRYGAASVYDAARRRVLMFGGMEGYRTEVGFKLADNRTWEWSGGDWRALSTLDTPTARGTAAMAQNPETGDIWMFGGGNELVSLDELFRFDGMRWTAIPKPAGQPWPEARAAASMAFDPISHKMVLFGGTKTFAVNERGNPVFGAALLDTWTWDGSSWAPLDATGAPPFRPVIPVKGETLPLYGLNRLLVDEGRGVVVMVSEALEGIQLRRWDPSTSAWVLEGTELPAPNFRFFSNPFWDFANGQIHVAGGYATNIPLGTVPTDLLNAEAALLFNGSMANDEWGLSGSRWRRWRPAGDPGARTNAGAAFHAGLGYGVLFGGTFGAATTLGDTWTWDGGRWAEGAKLDGSAGATLPPARHGHALAYDPSRVGPDGGAGALVMFGGVDEDGALLGDTWIWRDGWTKLNVTSPPQPRHRHALLSVPGGVILYGGAAAHDEVLRETWFLGATATAWTKLETSFFASYSMCVASLNDQAFSYGGDGLSGGSADVVFQRFGADRRWIAIPLPPDYPERRTDCALFPDPVHNQLILAGGEGAGEAKANFYRWTEGASSWREISVQPYDSLGEGPGRLIRPAYFYDPIARAATFYGGTRKDLDIQVGRTWRLRQVGDACTSTDGCSDALTCVDGVCCEASACGPCESCAIPGRRGQCAARGAVESVPGCAAERGLECNVEGRCRSREGAQCTEDAQCASGSCLGGACCSVAGCAQSCLDDHTQKNEDGTTTSCDEYKCQGVRCRVDCDTLADCSADHVCNTEHRCVPPETATGADSGCSCRVPEGSAPSSRGAGALIVLALVALSRRPAVTARSRDARTAPPPRARRARRTPAALRSCRLRLVRRPAPRRRGWRAPSYAARGPRR